jgi:hypothetical protein
MTVKKYAIPKVDEQGEDVTVSAGKFDSLLKKMLGTAPLSLAKLREEPTRLAARRPRKDLGPK